MIDPIRLRLRPDAAAARPAARPAAAARHQDGGIPDWAMILCRIVGRGAVLIAVCKGLQMGIAQKADLSGYNMPEQHLREKLIDAGVNPDTLYGPGPKITKIVGIYILSVLGLLMAMPPRREAIARDGIVRAVREGRAMRFIRLPFRVAANLVRNLAGVGARIAERLAGIV